LAIFAPTGDYAPARFDALIGPQTGDFIIQHSTNHAWINRSGRRYSMLFIMIGGQFSDETNDVGERFSLACLSALMTKG
jgi:hypothetical protein